MSALGRPRIHLRTTASTNDRARALAAAGAPHGTLVTASAQTAGRGRQGRTWAGPPGRALLCSLLLRECDPLLPLRAGLAVADLAGAAARVKWPNDVLLDGRKLAGILVEARPQDGWAVLGVGLNLSISSTEFPPDLRNKAVSLLSPSSATEVLSSHLERWVEAEPGAVLGAWRSRDALRGKEIAWEGGSGVADGVDDRGYLVVVTAGGDRVALGAGEVHLTRF